MNQPKTRKEREVWQAINSLIADGLRIDDLRGELIANRLLDLGFNRGSSTDIYRFKRSWIAANSVLDENPSLSLASNLSDPITQAASALKEKITLEAQQEIKKIREKAEKEQALLEGLLLEEKNKTLQVIAERDDFFEKLKNTENTLNHCKILLEKTEKSLTDSTQKNEILQIELQHLQEEKKAIIENREFLQKQQAETMHAFQIAEKNRIDEIKTAMENQRHNLLLEIDGLKELTKSHQLIIDEKNKVIFSLKEKLLLQEEKEKTFQHQIMTIESEKKSILEEKLNLFTNFSNILTEILALKKIQAEQVSFLKENIAFSDELIKRKKTLSKIEVNSSPQGKKKHEAITS